MVDCLCTATFACEPCAAEAGLEPLADATNPAHYKSHPSGIECIQVTEHMGFLAGNAVKYLWRAGSKGDEVEDLRKALWYIERRIAQLEQ